VEFGPNEAGIGSALYRVPTRYGDASRQAQTILQENSASSMPSTPLITFYITGLDYDRPRMQNPNQVNSTTVRQRTYDTNTNTYEAAQGNAFTVEQYMPVPYKLSISVDIWTSNTNQKFQILEQILPLFNPSLEIQSTDNYLDWTSLSVIELLSTGWSSRQIPQGTEDPIDISTLKFVLPIWLSLPAKVKKMGVVETVVASMYNANGDFVNAIANNDLLLGTRQYITPYQYQVVLIGNKLQILSASAVVDQPNSSLTAAEAVANSQLTWPNVIAIYGVLRPGVSLIALTQASGSQVFGTVVVDPSNEQFLLFNVLPESIPANTLSPVNAVIDPLRSAPSMGLVAATAGQRYLLTQGTANAQGWMGDGNAELKAHANDIIEYDGARWSVSFDSQRASDVSAYVTNIYTEIQYRWTGTVWVKSYAGLYSAGAWSLII